VKHLSRAFAAGLVIALAGCTHATPEPSLPAVPDLSVSTAQGQLQGKLLAESDLPAGYEETMLPTVQGGFGSLIGCPSLEPPAPSDADEARVSFAGVTAGNLIAESVRVSGPEQSHRMLAELAKAPQQCGAARATTAPKLGTESTALELNATLTGTGTVVSGYIVGLRDDQILVLVVYVSPGKADRAAADTITRIAWEKAANGTRPTPTIGS
jgi:hypothetical protein